MTYNYYVRVAYFEHFVEVSEKEYEDLQDCLMQYRRDQLSWKTIHVPDDPYTDACQMFLDDNLVGFVTIPSYDID